MKSDDKKAAVLAILRQQQEALNLSDLMQALGPEYRERTIRRWLSQMIEEGLVERLGHKRNTQYRAIEPAKPILPGFSQKSREVLNQVRRPLFERAPITYNLAWLQEYQPNDTYYLSKAIQEQLSSIGQRSTDKEPAGTYARRIYNRLLIDLSYNSSRLEGNTYSLIDTKRLITEGTSAEGKLDEEAVMILNHKEAIRHLVDSASKIHVNVNEISTLHFLLADGLVPPKYAGKVRDYGMHIGGSTYIPLENPVQLKQQLMFICQQAAQIQSPFEQSFYLLVHIAYLQAFVDINKRTARLSANIALVQNNFVPLSFNDVDKDDYISAMIAIYELNNVQPLMELYAYSYSRSCQLYDATAEAMGFDEIRVRYRQQRREIIRYIIVNQLIGDAMRHYMTSQTTQLIPKEDQADFLEDIKEDLNEMGPQQIVGLGVTMQQLNNWLQKKI